MTTDRGPPVVCLLGPTASGKTELACQLYERGDIDLISVDSAMVYRGLDIGTAKPSPDELARYPHALVDIRDPEEVYSVADFIADATRAVEASRARGRIPLLVGGTMLYFKRLFDGLAALPGADVGVRRALDAEAAQRGWPALHAELVAVDAAAAARIAPNDAQRIQRALEVFRLSGVPISELQGAQSGPDWPMLRIALFENDRAWLHARIGERFDRMLRDGFEDEVRGLLSRPGMHAGLPSLRAVGYRQVAAWLTGECSREQAIADAKTATRRLAKRQFTWLRGMAGICRLEPRATTLVANVSDLIERALDTE